MRSNWLISFCLVLLLLISDGAIASGKGVAVSGTVPAAVTNSASLVGIDAPVLKLNVGFDQNQSRMYQLSYAEPDYGTGAGLLNFVHQNSLWQIKYAVASNLVPYVDLGMDVRFLKLTETGDKYISTDFGVQLGDFWLLRLFCRGKPMAFKTRRNRNTPTYECHCWGCHRFREHGNYLY